MKTPRFRPAFVRLTLARVGPSCLTIAITSKGDRYVIPKFLPVGSFVLSSIVLTLIGYSDREWILGGNYSTERGSDLSSISKIRSMINN